MTWHDDEPWRPIGAATYNPEPSRREPRRVRRATRLRDAITLALALVAILFLLSLNRVDAGGPGDRCDSCARPTPRPTPVVVGITPRPTPILATPAPAPALLPDTSTLR